MEYCHFNLVCHKQHYPTILDSQCIYKKEGNTEFVYSEGQLVKDNLQTLCNVPIIEAYWHESKHHHFFLSWAMFHHILYLGANSKNTLLRSTFESLFFSAKCPKEDLHPCPDLTSYTFCKLLCVKQLMVEMLKH